MLVVGLASFKLLFVETPTLYSLCYLGSCPLLEKLESLVRYCYIYRGSWTSAYGIWLWNLWNELPDLIFPEPWRGKYSNWVTNFMCHMHECKILFITHLSLIWLNAHFNLFSILQPQCCGGRQFDCDVVCNITVWRSLNFLLHLFSLHKRHKILLNQRWRQNNVLYHHC
jgi:hypothetical protein